MTRAMTSRPIGVVTLVLVLAFGLLSMPAAAQDLGNRHIGATVVQRLGCLRCHGSHGEAADTDAPFLAGQNQVYLRNQMRAMRDGKARLSGRYRVAERRHAGMEAMLHGLDDVMLDNLASYFSNLPCRSDPSPIEAAPPQLAARCSFCHGAGGKSPFSTYPRLAGQKRVYLIEQLRAFALSAQNPAFSEERFHRMMAPILLNANGDEIRRLAAYFAAQPCR